MQKKSDLTEAIDDGQMEIVGYGSHQTSYPAAHWV